MADDWVTGQIGGALEFDGDNDFVEIPDNNQLDLTGALSMALWMKVNDSGPLNTGAGLFSKSRDDGKFIHTSVEKVYELAFHNDKLFFQISDGSQTSQASAGIGDGPSPMNDGNFHHIAATWNGTTDTDGMRLYFDGQEVATATAKSASIQSLNSTLNIGGSEQDTYQFAGAIDDVRLYDEALSSQQIGELSTGTAATAVPEPSTACLLLSMIAASFVLYGRFPKFLASSATTR